MRTTMVIILVNRMLLFFQRRIIVRFEGVGEESVVLSFCHLTVFAFFLQDYKYGGNENN
jgi:hypothetical protein